MSSIFSLSSRLGYFSIDGLLFFAETESSDPRATLSLTFLLRDLERELELESEDDDLDFLLDLMALSLISPASISSSRLSSLVSLANSAFPGLGDLAFFLF